MKRITQAARNHVRIRFEIHVERFSPLSMNDSLVRGSVQMSSVRTWAGGRPALCLWPMDQPAAGQNPPDRSPYLRGRGS